MQNIDVELYFSDARPVARDAHWFHKMESFNIDVMALHVRTPTCEVARRACIPCIEAHMKYIDALSDADRDAGLSAKRSAQQFVIECIAYGPCVGRQPSADHKYAAIIWCLDRGFPPCVQIFEFEKRYTPKHLAEFARRGLCPIYESLDWYFENDKWREIFTIRDNVNDELFKDSINKRLDIQLADK